MTRVVRRATSDDVWAVHETARESWHAAYDEILGPTLVDEVVDDWYAIGDLESAITDALERENATFLVVEPEGTERLEPSDSGSDFDGDCLGFAHVVPWPEDRSVAYLARLYIRPDYWRAGAGSSLLERLEADLESSFDRMRLSVLADNEIGISFYESAGFECVDVRSTDLADGLEECVYEKPL
ncbi:Acetyltransferase (GNAT) family protein [Natronorubrum sediminis]|uniref:Acetyltransferase (GNAT) family protein n=1 Tax=Natronorubrum sediminis TaxID=640943 RepID=A0A1H6G2S0_9EURY|nr:GNAT family N-acetyltransferase [Natronorubrum sediminis]SEH16284.1 Acetyltransferase (GNAT) family protein [Natronorubrum sediminis]